jgi:GxxExxY protein
MEILFKEESYSVMGACFEVRNEMGSGFLEDVYHEAMIREIWIREIPFVSKPKMPIYFKEFLLTRKYEPDFVVYEKIILELKAVKCLTDERRAPVHNYLKASKLRLGLLVNFGNPTELEYERIVR